MIPFFGASPSARAVGCTFFHRPAPDATRAQAHRRPTSPKKPKKNAETMTEIG
ncbi:MAG: hypothetical protein HXL28_09045 [Prevotellaceae bacterium]|nr:hypothetical protein [Prevotellaceae bacterium]